MSEILYLKLPRLLKVTVSGKEFHTLTCLFMICVKQNVKSSLFAFLSMVCIYKKQSTAKCDE